MLVEAPGLVDGSTSSGSDGATTSSSCHSNTVNSNSNTSNSTSKSSSSSSTEVKTALSGRAPMDVEARLANTPPHVLIRSISSLSQHSIRPRTPDTQVCL